MILSLSFSIWRLAGLSITPPSSTTNTHPHPPNWSGGRLVWASSGNARLSRGGGSSNKPGPDVSFWSPPAPEGHISPQPNPPPPCHWSQRQASLIDFQNTFQMTKAAVWLYHRCTMHAPWPGGRPIQCFDKLIIPVELKCRSITDLKGRWREGVVKFDHV